MAEPAKRYAVVTGANKGIGFGICRQLASNGVTVAVTARDEKRGLEAVEKLKESGVAADHVIFHRLDVADPASIASLADFLNTQFGKLDILEDTHINSSEITTQTYELAEECFKTNFYGAKRMIEALLPLNHLSNSPRIVNVSPSMGKLKNIHNEWAKGVLSDGERLPEERVDEVLREFLKDFKEGSLESKGWPDYMSGNIVSKADLNAYTRIVAKKYPSFRINCVCPGFVKTDITGNSGSLTIDEGAESPVRLALLPSDCPSGLFFYRSEVADF